MQENINKNKSKKIKRNKIIIKNYIDLKRYEKIKS